MNALQQLIKLTSAPVAARTVVTVISTNPVTGTSIVQTMGGSQLTVLGTEHTAGARVYIEGRRVIGQAAALPYSEIEV